MINNALNENFLENDPIEDKKYTIFINSLTLNDQTETNLISTSKYQWSTFFPKLLMYQFSRMANIYFLIIAVLQTIGEISYSGGGPVILIPLGIVIIINGIKDFFEDLNRKTSDEEENNSTCLVYNKIAKRFYSKKWREIVLGDIVKIENNNQFPADLLLLNSSDPNGICYIETKNIDGETSLKFKQANKEIKDLTQDESHLYEFNYLCITKEPNEFIYQFDANLYEYDSISGHIMNKENFIIVDRNSFLLRGSSLKQTDYIIGAVIYVGPNTKSMINSPIAKMKTSTIEYISNYLIISILIIQIVLSIIFGIIYNIFYNVKFNQLKYYIYPDKFNDKTNVSLFPYTTGTWILLMANFVPISLLVTMESIKFFQGLFISWDANLYDRIMRRTSLVQTCTLNDELGQVQYIFSDKTGTLTKNVMKFKYLSIRNERYGEEKLEENNNILLKDNYGKISNVDYYDPSNKLYNILSKENDDYSRHFMLCLSLCNSVIIDNRKFTREKIIEYQSSSPDEQALVYFARSVKYTFKSRSIDNKITLEIFGREVEYEVMNILEYSSERKRMGVIIKDDKGDIYLYEKGADSIITMLLSVDSKSSDIFENTVNSISTFAVKGLRTLMIAYKKIEKEDYDNWNNKYIQLTTNINRKEIEINKLYDEIETNFILLGSTAIDDQLQDYVDETLTSFISIGIRIWMLTGDKLDTAKNIAYSCKLFTSSMEIIHIKENSSLNEIKLILKSNFSPLKTYGLLISSEELTLIFSDPKVLVMFSNLCIKCLSVVCSRVSPKQKAEIVSLIKTSQNVITLAIGDGANDVGMITEANIGIGIQGVEGTQAARASDYAISQFSYLKRLLLYHGRESYRKNAFSICYQFYKNILLVCPNLWMGVTNFYSGQMFFDSWLYQCYNSIFTAVPIVFWGVLDKEHEPEYLEQNSNYYIKGLYGKLFHAKRFWKYAINGIVQGLLLFEFSVWVLSHPNSKGYQNDFWAYGILAYSGIVFVPNIKILFVTNNHTLIATIFLILSILSFYFVVIGMSFIKKFSIYGDANVLIDIKYILGTFEIVTLILFVDIFIGKAAVYFGFVTEVEKLLPYKGKNNWNVDREDFNGDERSSELSIQSDD